MKSVKSKLQAAHQREAFDKVFLKVDSKAWRHGQHLMREVDMIVYWQLRAQVLSQVEGKL
jgi:hypothetical protein